MKYFATCVVLLSLFSCNKEKKQTDGLIAGSVGTAVIEHIQPDGSKQTRPARRDEKVFRGDAIVTGIDGNVLLEISGAQIEIQRNTRFVYEQDGSDKKVYLQNGNAWTSVSKQGAADKFTLRTPTTVAGVRGTKFFTFTDGLNTGICHCEGQVSTLNIKSGKEDVNTGDFLEFYRGERSIIVTTPELIKLGMPGGHAHSELEQSALGKKSQLTPAQYKKMQDYVEKKFLAAK
jgi:hypothetical protein